MPDGEHQLTSETDIDGSTAPRSRRPVAVFALLDRLRRHRFGLVAGAFASLTLLRAVGQERSLGWAPTGDTAVIAARAVDFLSTNTPLIGQASMASDSASVHSPGPALYWLLAVPARIGPFWLQPAMMALVGVLVIVSACVISEHLAGRWASALTALTLVLLVRSVDAAKLVRPMNPYTGLSLIVATWFLAWLAASGRRGAYPALIVAASAAVHMHLTYVVPATIAVAIATIALFGPTVLGRFRGDRHDPDGHLRWLLAGVGAGLVMWLLPIWQQLTSSPGNLGAILGATDDDTPRRGFGKAVGVIAHSLGWQPRFLNREILDPMPTWMVAPSTIRTVTTWIVIGVATALLIDAIRRRDRIVTAGFAIAAGAVVSLLIGYAMMPASGPGALTTFYTMRWMAPVGMLVWLFIAIGAIRSVSVRIARHTPGHDRTPVAERGGLGSAITMPMSYGIVAVTAVIGAVSAIPAGHESWTHAPARTLGDAAVEVVEPGQRYLVDGDRSRPSLALTPAVVYRLRRAGVAVTMSPALHVWVDPLGDSYAPAGRPCDGRLTVRTPTDDDEPDRIAIVDTARDGSGDGPFIELVHDPTDLPDAC